MNRLKNLFLMLALLLLGFTTAHAGVSFTISVGSGGYYQPVGDYDYLPYGYQTQTGQLPPRINFYDMMGQYGAWVSVDPFGQVWKPYASNDWRPYTYGHWISTQQYGQMWEGYEPWAWAGYHYGNWIFTPNYGWVWIPGYDWHSGRVTWARSYGSIGWMPSPPAGYDYSRGYLSNVGPDNQFGYSDSDFGNDYGYGNFNQGGPYNDPRYRNMYYNPGYNNVVVNLWIFVDNAHYGYDNYADYSLGSDYTRHVFDQRMVRISNQQVDRSVLERIVGQKLQDTAVEVKELQTNKRTIKVVVPTGTQDVDRIRKNSTVVVRNIIAPGFASKQKSFKGQDSKNQAAIGKLFHQEYVSPKIENLTSEQIANQARDASLNREKNRVKRDQVEKDKIDKVQKESKVREIQNQPGEPQKSQQDTQSELQKSNQKQKDAQNQKEQEARMKGEEARQQQLDVQKQKDHDAANQAGKQQQHDAQVQNEIRIQKEQAAQQQRDLAKQADIEQEARLQREATKQKHQDELDAAQNADHGNDTVEGTQTQESDQLDSQKKSDQASPQDSKDKKTKSKHKSKDKKPEDQPPTKEGL